MTASPASPSPFPTLPNFRDLGYWPAADGKIVKPGALYRSTEFLHTGPDDLQGVTGLGLQTIVDLRTEPEIAGCPDPKIDGVREVPLNILGDATHSALGANLGKVTADPTYLRSVLTEFTVEKAKAAMVDTYRELIESDSAKKNFGEFYRQLLAGELAPTLFHCTTGKDRTGWAAASFLTLMGVAEKDVYTDYLLTNERLVPALAPIVDKLEAAGANAAALNAVLGVEKDYLDSAFDLVEKGWGSIEAYFTQVLGVDEDGQAALRESFLIDPAA